MTITLLPDYDSGLWPFGAQQPNWDPLTEAPNYVRSEGATRWHRARSGRRWHSGRVSYGYWCGANYGEFGAEIIGLGDDLCGTCEGRWVAQRDNPWIFTPMKCRRPTLCPASGREDMVPPGSPKHFTCPACGEPANWRGVSRYYAGVAVVRHNAGPDLVDPCPWHGWNCLRFHDGRVMCGCQVGKPRPGGWAFQQVVLGGGL